MKPFTGRAEHAQEMFDDVRTSFEQLVTAEDIAAILKVSTKSIYRWASEGRLPAFREGRLIRFLKSDVDAFIKSRTGVGTRGMD